MMLPPYIYKRSSFAQVAPRMAFLSRSRSVTGFRSWSLSRSVSGTTSGSMSDHSLKSSSSKEVGLTDEEFVISKVLAE